MKKILTLTASTYVRVGEPIILPDTVEIEFESPTYRHNLGVLHVKVSNGAQGKTYKLSERVPLDITEYCTHAGVVDITVALVIRGETVKTWRVEPLIIKEVEHTLAVIPEVEEMKAQLAEMQAQLAEMRKAFAEIVTLVRESESI